MGKMLSRPRVILLVLQYQGWPLGTLERLITYFLRAVPMDAQGDKWTAEKHIVSRKKGERGGE